MADTDFDPFAYIRSAPNVTIESGILLARTLVAAMPKRMPAQVKKSAAKLTKVADAAQVVLGQRQDEQGQPVEETSRDVDVVADQVWSALHDMLDALGRLSPKHARVGKARLLRSKLFPERTGFLRLPYSEQFVTMDTMLRRIDEQGLAKTLDAVVGPEFLEDARGVHPRYSAMVGGRLNAQGAAGNLLDQVRALQRAILEYATAVASTVDSDVPATIAPARQALRPIDNHRELLASGRRPDAASEPESDEPESDEPEPAEPESAEPESAEPEPAPAAQ